ncbi:hypothetical protein DPMN_102919 [Dreissena polymorpha]|uniref:Uncharacterized protein n=1 Tax=Dreissena polymorpha TaxID=45954 RepID=A0A9D4HA16_DREPO|nr:hypothetical protein DPMN_102919 [Dreissena polymorpha]
MERQRIIATYFDKLNSQLFVVKDDTGVTENMENQIQKLISLDEINSKLCEVMEDIGVTEEMVNFRRYIYLKNDQVFHAITCPYAKLSTQLAVKLKALLHLDEFGRR